MMHGGVPCCCCMAVTAAPCTLARLCTPAQQHDRLCYGHTRDALPITMPSCLRLLPISLHFMQQC